MATITTLRDHLTSPNKPVRLKALKLILTHPEATPLDLVQCLCSHDNRDFEFLHTFGLDAAMRSAWPRLLGAEDAAVYEYLGSLYASNPHAHGQHVVFVLELLGTQRALKFLDRIQSSAPEQLRWAISHARDVITSQAVS